ncbi:hypothetical protein LXL04_001318 [Taraxacum kok-saghyz]
MEIIEEDWELVNDDGFVYKRLKRPRLASTSTFAVAPPDPAAEAKARRERKKKALLKLKTKYEQEIQHWEQLSNTLKALQDRTQNQSSSAVLPDQSVSVSQENLSAFPLPDLTNTLLAQVLTHPLLITVFGLLTLRSRCRYLPNSTLQRIFLPNFTNNLLFLALVVNNFINI